MRAVAPVAEVARAKWVAAAADNPFITMQQQVSKSIVDGLNLFRDLRDDLVERTFHAVYGSPLVQLSCGISQNSGSPRPRPGVLPSILAAAEEERGRLEKRWARELRWRPRHGCWSISARLSIASRRAPSKPCASCFSSSRKSRQLSSRLLYATSGRSWPWTNAPQSRPCRSCYPRMPRRVALSPI